MEEKNITFNFAFRRWFNEKVTKHINVREYRRGNQNGQSRETDNIGYTRPRKTKQKTQHNMCWASLFANKHK
jgi:hypothetical protein